MRARATLKDNSLNYIFSFTTIFSYLFVLVTIETEHINNKLKNKRARMKAIA